MNTFEEWYEPRRNLLDNRVTTKDLQDLWLVAQKSERERIIAIISNVALDSMSEQWMWCCNEVKDRIEGHQ
jgi:hypothetical protein